jgi:hypothetical protein
MSVKTAVHGLSSTSAPPPNFLKVADRRILRLQTCFAVCLLAD